MGCGSEKNWREAEEDRKSDGVDKWMLQRIGSQEWEAERRMKGTGNRACAEKRYSRRGS